MEKRERQQQIVEILRRNRIDSQEQLRDLLSAEGLEVTQSTLSRDLRDLGAVKGNSGYQPPAEEADRRGRIRALAQQVEGSLESVDCGGNIVLIRTAGPRAAAEVAARVAESRLHEVVGALPSGGAVLIVARTPAYAREIVQGLRQQPRRAVRRR